MFRSAHDRQRSLVPAGALGAACVLWWAFARTDRLAVFVFQIERGQPIFEVDYVFKRYAAVWVGGVTLACAFVVGAVALRKLAAGGRALGAGLRALAEVVVAVLAWVTVKELMNRPFLSPESAVALVAILAVVILDAWRQHAFRVRTTEGKS